MNEQKNNPSGSDKRLHDLEKEINRMGAMAADALARAKATGFSALESLISKQDATRERMRGVGEASGDAWQELKQGLESAWGDLHGAVQNAISKFQQRELHERQTTPHQKMPAKKSSTTTSSPAKAAKKSMKKKPALPTKKKSTTPVRGRTSKRK